MNERFLGLQLLRFVAAMLVVLMHTAEAISLRSPSTHIFNFWGPGSVGVDIFFVISGFVMAISTERIDPSKKRFSAAKDFLLKRVIRIAPLYWFYTTLKILMIILLPALALRSSIDPKHILASFAFIPVQSPWGLTQPILPVGWTLNFEMFFYLIFSIAIAFNFSRLLLPLAIFSIMFIAAEFMTHSTVLEFYSVSIIFEFILGIIVFHAYKKLPNLSIKYGAGLFFIAFYLIFFVDWQPTTDRLTTFGIASALLVFSIATLEKKFRSKAIEKLSILGDVSYSTYLSHSFTVPGGVFLFVKIGLTSFLPMILGVSMIVIVGSFISYYLIEKPLTTISKNLLLGR